MTVMTVMTVTNSNESSIIPLNYTGSTNNLQEIDIENEIGGEFSINNND